MKTTITECDFIQAFRDRGRQDSFSDTGKRALYAYFTELEDDCGMEIELDPIAFDCEYCEFEDLAEFHDNYEKAEYPNMEAIHANTQVIEIPDSNGFIIASF